MTAVAVDAMLPLLAVVCVVANLSTLGTCLFAPAMGFPMAKSLTIITAQWVLDVSINTNAHVASCNVRGRLRTIKGTYNCICFSPFRIVVGIPDRDYYGFCNALRL